MTMKLKWQPHDVDYNTSPNNERNIVSKTRAAQAAIPAQFVEIASPSKGTKRLNEAAIQAAKGEPVSRFDTMKEMFIVEYKGMYGVPRTGLFYVTQYMGFGDIHGVIIQNTDANGYYFLSNGAFTNGDNEYAFYKIKNTAGGKRSKRTRKHTRKHRKHTRKH
jgi:hypothetical protein